MKTRCLASLSFGLLLICWMSFSPVAAEKASLKIGAIFSVTGKASSLGLPEKNTVLMVAEGINKAGGVNGFPLEVIVVDDETSEAGAKSGAEKLMDSEKVLAIIGPSTSGNSLAVKPIAEAARVPMVSCAAAEAIVTPVENSRFSFKTPQLDSHVAVRMLEHMQQSGTKKVAVLAESSPFGKNGAMQVKRYAPDYGVDVVAEEFFAINATDMTAYLEKAKAAGAQAIVNWSVVPAQTIVPKNAKKMGLGLPMYHSHAFGNPKYVEICEDACEGIIFPTGRLLVVDLLPADHFHKSLLMNYKNEYGKQFGAASTFGGHAYDALWIVVNAIKSKKITPGTDVAKARELIRDGIEETRGWLGTAGEFNMSSSDHTGLDKDKSLELCTVKARKIVPLLQR